MEYDNSKFEDTASENPQNKDTGTETAADENTGYRASADGRQSTGTFQPPPPSMDVNGPRRLYRTNGPLAGVAGGLAEYFSVDPVLVRLGVAAAGIVGFPVVPLVYVAAWIIVPRADPAPIAAIAPIMAPNPVAHPAPPATPITPATPTTSTVVHPDAPAPSPESISAP